MLAAVKDEPFRVGRESTTSLTATRHDGADRTTVEQNGSAGVKQKNRAQTGLGPVCDHDTRGLKINFPGTKNREQSHFPSDAVVMLHKKAASGERRSYERRRDADGSPRRPPSCRRRSSAARSRRCAIASRRDRCTASTVPRAVARWSAGGFRRSIGVEIKLRTITWAALPGGRLSVTARCRGATIKAVAAELNPDLTGSSVVRSLSGH